MIIHTLRNKRTNTVLRLCPISKCTKYGVMLLTCKIFNDDSEEIREIEMSLESLKREYSDSSFFETFLNSCERLSLTAFVKTMFVP